MTQEKEEKERLKNDKNLQYRSHNRTREKEKCNKKRTGKQGPDESFGQITVALWKPQPY